MLSVVLICISMHESCRQINPPCLAVQVPIALEASGVRLQVSLLWYF